MLPRDAPSRAGKMASPLFLQGLLNDLGLKPFLGIPLLQPPVLVFEFLQAGHQRGIHTAEFAAPFVERGGTDAVLTTELRNWAASLCLLEHGNDLSVPDARRLKELERENAKLKRLLAESILDAEALKAALGRKR